MHAGDGNVHVNVPVLSNDRPMLQRAEQVIDRVMEKVVALGGVVSGEHGIGVTKLKYLEPERIAELSAHRREVDPGGLMNPGKLEDLAVLDQIFTPSFNLLELEARILQHGQLEELARSIAHCVRCGKCKPDCCVYHPARGMFFHPRNKNLAIGSLIEALLYDAQRERSTRFELLRWLEDVADHCTICHKCLKPCPVDIDSGEVSVLERGILQSWGYKNTTLATRAALGFLESRSPTYNKLFRSTVVRLGGAVQRAAVELVAPLQPADGRPGPYPLQMLRSPLPRIPAETLRDVIPPCDQDQVLVFEPPPPEDPPPQPRSAGQWMSGDKGASADAIRTVFYFPGCGSERYQSHISMAALHVLVSLGTRVVLPPPYLCCGFPAHVNAKNEQHSRQVLRDTILFSQIREMFSYVEFDGCVITCGTCREGLAEMDAAKLFGGRLLDVSAYALERGLELDGERGRAPLPPALPRLPGREGRAGDREARRLRRGGDRPALLLRGGDPGALAPGHHRRHAPPEAGGALRAPRGPPAGDGPHELPVLRERPAAEHRHGRRAEAPRRRPRREDVRRGLARALPRPGGAGARGAFLGARLRYRCSTWCRAAWCLAGWRAVRRPGVARRAGRGRAGAASVRIAAACESSRIVPSRST